MAEAIFWVALLGVAYVYAGYPALLWIAGKLKRVESAMTPEDWPPVTLIISAYNEERSIGQKVENTLSLDYPGALEVVVVSDASDDKTDAIVREFASRGVKLLRMSERGGKTIGLNAAAGQATGDVLVFSDANAMYRKDAVRELVAGFSSPEIGAVIGE